MKTCLVSFRALVVMTLLTGLIYPLAVTGLGQLLFSKNAKGDLTLIGQKFTAEKYFWSRPSAVDYNPLPSGGSNAGSTHKDWIAKVKERRAAGATNDLLYASASGLDPHISPASALSQVGRVAKARGVQPQLVHDIVLAHIEGRQLGFLGEERINALKLNMAIDAQLK